MAEARRTGSINDSAFFMLRRSLLFQELIISTKAAIKVLYHLIALASSLLEAFAIQYLHRTAHIFNQPGASQGSCRKTHAGSAGTEHLRQKFVR